MSKKKETVSGLVAIIFIVAAILTAYFVIPRNKKTENPPTSLEQQVSANFTFEMQKNQDDVYYLKVNGYVSSDVIPDEISVVVFGEKQTLQIKTIGYVENQYRCSFDAPIEKPKASLRKGTEYHAMLYVVMPDSGNVVGLNNVATFYADDDYTQGSYVNLESGETGSGYFKESEWIGPY